MKQTPGKIQNIALEIISFLFILLFVYAAVSKLMDLQKFTVQLGQSPMLTRWAGFVAWSIPSIELLISVLLVFSRTRRGAMVAALNLMVIFTAYIVIVTNFSKHVPCSCGGVLEKLGWAEHLIFNCFFIVLAIAALVLLQNQISTSGKIFPAAWRITILTSLVVPVVFVTSLFLFSYDFSQQHNKFLRQFPSHVIMAKDTFDIRYDSYYIAGGSKTNIYLGNYRAALHVLKLNTALADTQFVSIHFKEEKSLKVWAARVTVDSPDFYFMAGTVPAIYHGKITDWHATRDAYDSAYFVESIPIAPGSFVLKSLDATTKEHVLVKETLQMPHTTLKPGLLQKQVDGIFCVDGMMAYDKRVNRLVYTYFYRNQYIVMDTALNLLFRGKTIDTVSHARLNLSTIASEQKRVKTGTSVLVNSNSAVYGQYLFVHSRLMAENEDKDEFESSVVIDVYDLSSGTYKFSFYLRDFRGGKPGDFKIINNRLVVLYDHYLLTYDLVPKYFPDK